jgi:hypothetical protein
VEVDAVQQQDFANTLNDLSQSTLDAVNQLSVINGRLAEKLAAQQFDAATLCMQGGIQQLKLAQESKDVKDFLSKQTALVEEYAGKWLDLTKAQVGLAQAAGDEFKGLFEHGLERANSAVTTTAKKAAATTPAA